MVAVKQVKSQERVMKAALERRIEETTLHPNAALPWVIAHAGAIITLRRVGPGGRTPYERLRGRRFKGKVTELED